MKVLSTLLLALVLMFTACGGGGAGNSSDGTLVGDESSEYLSVSFNSSNDLIPIGQYLSLTFSSVIDAATVDEASIFISDVENTLVPAKLTVIDEVIEIVPNEFFLPSSQYKVNVTTAVLDTAGRTLKSDFILVFTTDSDPDVTPPTLLSLFPFKDGSADKGTHIAMEFDEVIAGEGVLVLRDASNSKLNGSSQMESTQLSFISENELTPDEDYTVTLEGNVTDRSGNAYEGIKSWSFDVNAESIEVNTGYANLMDPVLDLGVGAHAMTTYTVASGEQYIVVGIDTGIRLYRVNVVEGYPALSFAGDYETASKVIALDVKVDLQYIIAGTEADGMYVIEAPTMHLVDHFKTLRQVNGVSSATSDSGVAYIYAASALDGFYVYEVEAGKVKHKKTIRPTKGTLSDVTALSDRTPYRVYLLTGDEGVMIYDEASKLETDVTIAGGLNTITYGDKDAAGDDRVYVLTSSAKSYNMSLSGDLSSGPLQTFIKGADLTTFTDTVVGKSYSYLSSPDSGVLVRALFDEDDVTRITVAGSAIAANAFGSGDEGFLALLEKEGQLSLFNAIQDKVFPIVPNSAVERILDTGVVKITFSEYVDPATVTIDKFDISRGNIVNVQANGKVVTVISDTTLQAGDVLFIGKRAGLKDRIGNDYNNGVLSLHGL